ncbi:TRAP transporter permease [Algihabitans albus]|uniref:TRAP transporter permease n=1 Tax=Algihabitans albus TaxID=2164067 RepID=UPI0013C2FE6C|nr:TRAP transporter fused permease subunit [Algihabitans albus]
MPAARPIADERRGGDGAGDRAADGGPSPTFRRLPAWLLPTIPAVALALACFHLYTGAFGAFPNIQQRAPHVGLCLVLALLLFAPARRLDGSRIALAVDGLLIAAVLVTCGWVVVQYDRIMSIGFFPLAADTWLGVALTLVLLEVTRRVVGWLFPLLAVAFVAYAYFGPLFPGAWAHRGLSLELISEVLYSTDRGIWGLVTGVSATVIAMFVIFGGILLKTGGGQTFMDLALYLSGRFTGGGAKVATVASSLFGTVSGSAAANVATTGTFTIAMMRKLGYRRSFAGAVEAVASSGGQIMPPIMGAGAFIMAELLGVSYMEVALAAVIPAILYFTSCFAAIHFEARRCGYGTVDRKDVPSPRTFLHWRRSLPVFGPLALLISLLVMGYTPATGAFWATTALMAAYLALGTEETFAGRLRMLLDGLILAGRGLVVVAILIACSQIILAMIAGTGVGVKFSALIISLAQDHLLLSLVLAMGIAMVLGMGLPTSAAYILAAAVVAPALIRLDLLPMQAHLFVFYYAILSGITPPLCATVFIAAAMAEANWFKTALLALRLALAAFIVPFLLVYHPELILVGDPLDIIMAAVTGFVGTVALAASTIGWLVGPAGWSLRLVLAGAAIALIWPGLQSDALGLLLLLGSFGQQMLQERRRTPVTPSSSAGLEEKR